MHNHPASKHIDHSEAMATPRNTRDIPDRATDVCPWWFPFPRLNFNPFNLFRRPLPSLNTSLPPGEHLPARETASTSGAGSWMGEHFSDIVDRFDDTKGSYWKCRVCGNKTPINETGSAADALAQKPAKCDRCYSKNILLVKQGNLGHTVVEILEAALHEGPVIRGSMTKKRNEARKLQKRQKSKSPTPGPSKSRGAKSPSPGRSSRNAPETQMDEPDDNELYGAEPPYAFPRSTATTAAPPASNKRKADADNDKGKTPAPKRLKTSRPASAPPTIAMKLRSETSPPPTRPGKEALVGETDEERIFRKAAVESMPRTEASATGITIRGRSKTPATEPPSAGPASRGRSKTPASRASSTAPSPRGRTKAPATHESSDGPKTRKRSRTPASRASSKAPTTRGRSASRTAALSPVAEEKSDAQQESEVKKGRKRARAPTPTPQPKRRRRDDDNDEPPPDDGPARRTRLQVSEAAKKDKTPAMKASMAMNSASTTKTSSKGRGKAKASATTKAEPKPRPATANASPPKQIPATRKAATKGKAKSSTAITKKKTLQKSPLKPKPGGAKKSTPKKRASAATTRGKSMLAQKLLQQQDLDTKPSTTKTSARRNATETSKAATKGLVKATPPVTEQKTTTRGPLKPSAAGVKKSTPKEKGSAASTRTTSKSAQRLIQQQGRKKAQPKVDTKPNTTKTTKAATRNNAKPQARTTKKAPSKSPLKPKAGGVKKPTPKKQGSAALTPAQRKISQKFIPSIEKAIEKTPEGSQLPGDGDEDAEMVDAY